MHFTDFSKMRMQRRMANANQQNLDPEVAPTRVTNPEQTHTSLIACNKVS
jgi:hypothetical protein